jgi:hypothetical protein
MMSNPFEVMVNGWIGVVDVGKKQPKKKRVATTYRGKLKQLQIGGTILFPLGDSPIKRAGGVLGRKFVEEETDEGILVTRIA